MSGPDFTRAVWRKSSRSGTNGSCVEVARNLVTVQGIVGVRDSKDPTGPALAFSPEAFRVFTEGVKRGRFDLA